MRGIPGDEYTSHAIGLGLTVTHPKIRSPDDPVDFGPRRDPIQHIGLIAGQPKNGVLNPDLKEYCRRPGSLN